MLWKCQNCGFRSYNWPKVLKHANKNVGHVLEKANGEKFTLKEVTE